MNPSAGARILINYAFHFLIFSKGAWHLLYGIFIASTLVLCCGKDGKIN